ncbi:MAG: putative bifunctional diguanylate cyclase/phosphodiesterase [Coriobacteriales bacterium]
MESEVAAAPCSKESIDIIFNALETIAEGGYIYLCDIPSNYSRWSAEAVRRFALPAEYMLDAGAIWEERIHPDDRQDYRESISAILAGREDAHDMQYRALDRDGSYVVCTCRGTVLRDAAGTPLYFGGVIRVNGSQLNEDSLTGFLNHYSLFEHLDMLFEHRASARLMLIGISRFSTVNEMWGYGFGNTVIHKLVCMLKQEFRNEGALYRLDGVRFVLLTRTIELEDLPARFEALRQRIACELQVDGYHPQLAVYGSALEVADFSVEPKTVFGCLEYAASSSKETFGGDLQVFRVKAGEESTELLQIINEVRRSIEQGCAGFELHFQPVISAGSGQLCGAEALLRWRSPQRGLVPPARFIPLIENDPLFIRLGEWILRRAMESCHDFALASPGFELSVNLSYRQLIQRDFTSMVVRLLKETGFPACQLCLEVTERCRLLDRSRLAAVLKELQELGVLFAIDDFGTGYSSLEVLNELDFDVVKVDKSFVDHIVDDPKSERFVRTMKSLADACGAVTCAEGVETVQQLAAVRACGVDSIQGYYYSKPLPLDAFKETYG